MDELNRVLTMIEDAAVEGTEGTNPFEDVCPFKSPSAQKIWKLWAKHKQISINNAFEKDFDLDHSFDVAGALWAYAKVLEQEYEFEVDSLKQAEAAARIIEQQDFGYM